MTDILKKIEEEVKSNKIVIYMKGSKDAPQCGFSAAVVEVFNSLNVPYITRDILADNELREGIKKYSNWPTIPQVYVNGKFVGGCDITRELYKTGELQELVKGISTSTI
jgi:monothiol glutaredoxin